jgi:hypothetical protein
MEKMERGSWGMREREREMEDKLGRRVVFVKGTGFKILKSKIFNTCHFLSSSI